MYQIFYVSGVNQSGKRVLVSVADDLMQATCILGQAERSSQYTDCQIEEDELPDCPALSCVWDALEAPF